MAAGLPKFNIISLLSVFSLVTFVITFPLYAQDEVDEPDIFDEGDVAVEEVQTESETFTPAGVINVIRNTVETETQSDSASVDDVLIPTVESAVEDGVPPGNIVSLIKHLDKMGLGPDEMADAVSRLNDLIDEGMSPGQALNQVKNEMESDEDSQESTASEDSETVSTNSNSNGKQKDKGGPPENKGPGNNNGQGNGNSNDKGKGKTKK